MADILTVDIGHLLKPQEEPGFVSRSRFEKNIADNESKFQEFRDALSGDRYPLTIAFTESGEIPRIKDWARDIRHRFDNVLLIGMGGSSMGTRAIVQFLKGPYYNLSAQPRIFIHDNLDPVLVERLEATIDFGRTALIYISKSGSTAESAANFIYFFHRYRQAGGDPRDITIICDRLDNGINRIAGELGCQLFFTPPELGGRYSVLSCVGFIPAEIIGIDAEELLAGAAAVRQNLLASPARENPVFLLGNCLHELASYGKSIHVLFNYSSGLFDFGLWFMQLWAESLGKKHSLSGDVVRTGTTPLNALGATDQHSTLQLFKEGPLDKIFGFVNIETSSEISIPSAFPNEDEYAYFAGKSMHQQLLIQQTATEISLFKEGHPCYRVTARDYSAQSLGALFYFYQALTVYCGRLYGINPFDQPGVEEGKRMTYAMMGRSSYASERESYQAQVTAYLGDALKIGIEG